MLKECFGLAVSTRFGLHYRMAALQRYITGLHRQIKQYKLLFDKK